MVGTKPSPYSIFYSMDRKLTEKIQAYLQTEPAKRNVVEGATLLLSLNRNRILFQNVVKRPEKFADKVEYELKKHLQIRLDDKTMSEVAAMDATVVPFAENTLNKRLMLASDKADDIDVPEELEVAIRHAGKRTDHDELPDEIKNIWEQSANLWFKIKETYETLKTMDNAPLCDRYEYLKILDEADKQYRKNMSWYDGYVLGSEIPSEKEAELDPADIAKKIQAARKYISDNKKKLAELRESGEWPNAKYDELLEKVQERFNFLIETGNSVSDEQVTELKELGIVVE